MSTLTKRVITALVLTAIMLFTLFYLPPVMARILLGAFLLMGAWEWSGFCFLGNIFLRSCYVSALVILVALLAYGMPQGWPVENLLWLTLGWWLLVSCWILLGNSTVGKSICAIAGVFALVPAWYAVMRLFSLDNGAVLFVWVVVVVAAADIGAYFVGRAFGKRKLAPAISPGKTVAGLLGGAVSGSVAMAVGAWLLNGNWLLAGLFGVLLALLSVVGDLSVSVFKRSAGLKDSGWILPGHGGVLDRVDALTAVLPVFVLLLITADLVAI